MVKVQIETDDGEGVYSWLICINSTAGMTENVTGDVKHIKR